MSGLNDFLFQIVQPYFLYSVVFLSITFVSIAIFLKFTPYRSRCTQSILWLTPLLIPVIVLLMFHPQLVIHTAPFVPIATPKGMSVAAA